MAREPFSGHLDLLLLAALTRGPLHGYAIIDRIRSDELAALRLPRGHGLPRAAPPRGRRAAAQPAGPTSTGRRRRTYELTAAGREGARQPAARLGALRRERAGGARAMSDLDAYLDAVAREARGPARRASRGRAARPRRRRAGRGAPARPRSRRGGGARARSGSARPTDALAAWDVARAALADANAEARRGRRAARGVRVGARGRAARGRAQAGARSVPAARDAAARCGTRRRADSSRGAPRPITARVVSRLSLDVLMDRPDPARAVRRSGHLPGLAVPPPAAVRRRDVVGRRRRRRGALLGRDLAADRPARARRTRATGCSSSCATTGGATRWRSCASCAAGRAC